jgi:hypothetical protein
MEKPEVTIKEIVNEKLIVSPIKMENIVNVPEIKIPEIKIPEIKIPKTEVTVIHKSEEDVKEGKLLPPPKGK